MKPLDIRLLGPLEVRLHGRRLDLGTRKQRALMALLVINRGILVSTDGIVAALWGPDAPADRRKDVWVYVSRLRKVLEPEAALLQRMDGGYVLDAPDEAVDAIRFEALAEEGRNLVGGDPEAASLVLSEALAMWAGDALGEFAIEDFAVAEATRLNELRLTAVESRVEADLAWKDPEALIPEIQGLVAAHPLRPQPTCFLMLALYRRGRQAEALRAYRDFAELLAQAGLEPPDDVRAMEERILLDDVALHPADRRLHARIPEPIATFIGRHADLAKVGGLLSDHRLVTLTGLGGVGKTALATEVARRLAVDFDDAALIDLTNLEPGGAVAAEIASVLRLDTGPRDPMRTILDRLGSRRVLLVLDNGEHVAQQAGKAMVALLRGASGLRILATSRVVFDIPGEQVVRLEPLSIAPGGEAEQLLSERIAASGSAVREAVTGDDLHALGELTAGLPLAIELAAAQLRTRPAAEVIAALEDPEANLAVPNRVGPEHHRDLRASIAWSERLLPPGSATLLRRLAPFRSGFSLGAAEEVAGFGSLPKAEVRNELDRLVDASLVNLRRGTAGRYSLLEPVRQYAETRLHAVEEDEVVRERHALYFLDRIRELGPLIDIGSDPDALGMVRADAANLLEAVRWAIAAGEVESAQRATAAAIPFWRQAADMGERIGEVEAVLAMSSEPTRSRAELLFMSAPWHWLVRGEEVWLQHLAEIDELAAELGDPQISAWAALRGADGAMTNATDADEVIARYRTAAEALRRADPQRVVYALHQLGWYLYWQWDRWDELQTVIEEWTRVAETHGAERDLSSALALQSWVALAQQDYPRLEETAAVSAQIDRRLGDYRGAAMGMFPLAIGSLWQGDVDEAKRRIDISVVALRETGAVPLLVNNLLARACIELALGDQAAAAETVRSVLEMGSESISEMASVAAQLAVDVDDELAATLLGAAAARPLITVVHRLAIPALESIVGALEPRLRASMGGETFEAAWTGGQGMDPEDVLQMVGSVV